jgi:hypothetical protein
VRLTDLEPQFIRYESRVETWNVVDGNPETWRERGCPTKQVTGPREYRIFVDALAEAQGITFICPKCFANAGHSNAGVHLCEVTFGGRGVPDVMGTHNKAGAPTRWQVSGRSYSDLTTSPSILLEGEGCGWHGFITDGAIS